MQNKLKTLVIHPNDPSTDFLKEIYKDQKDWTIINQRGDIFSNGERPISRKETIEAIKSHDRIIMMGHGAPTGLFYTHINSKMVYLLREKECVCIWCNADQFVEQYGLKGFYTGMFISEVSEANYFGITTTQENVDISNGIFVDIVTEFIDDYKLHSHLKETYVGDCPVIQYNNKRLYYRDENGVLYPERILEPYQIRNAERAVKRDEKRKGVRIYKMPNDETGYDGCVYVS